MTVLERLLQDLRRAKNRYADLYATDGLAYEDLDWERREIKALEEKIKLVTQTIKNNGTGGVEASKIPKKGNIDEQA